MRNYKREAEWQHRKYDVIRAKIDKDLGQKLRLKLKKNNQSIAGWIRENIKKYISE